MTLGRSGPVGIVQLGNACNLVLLGTIRLFELLFGFGDCECRQVITDTRRQYILDKLGLEFIFCSHLGCTLRLGLTRKCRIHNGRPHHHKQRRLDLRRSNPRRQLGYELIHKPVDVRPTLRRRNTVDERNVLKRTGRRMADDDIMSERRQRDVAKVSASIILEALHLEARSVQVHVTLGATRRRVPDALREHLQKVWELYRPSLKPRPVWLKLDIDVPTLGCHLCDDWRFTHRHVLRPLLDVLLILVQDPNRKLGRVDVGQLGAVSVSTTGRTLLRVVVI